MPCKTSSSTCTGMFASERDISSSKEGFLVSGSRRYSLIKSARFSLTSFSVLPWVATSRIGGGGDEPLTFLGNENRDRDLKSHMNSEDRIPSVRALTRIVGGPPRRILKLSGTHAVVGVPSQGWPGGTRPLPSGICLAQALGLPEGILLGTVPIVSS